MNLRMTVAAALLLTGCAHYLPPCDGWNPKSCADRGAALLSGVDFPRDERGAFQAYERGCRLGDTKSCTELGRMYGAGQGVERDSARAAKILETQCKQGDSPEACEYLRRPTPPSAMAVSCTSEISKDQIRETIQSNRGALVTCYTRARDSQPTVEGKYTAYFEIAPSGQVVHVKTKESTTNSAALDNCIQSEMVGWRFPCFDGVAVVKVTYPFIFRDTENVASR
jgi:hypothetical protein